MSLYIHEVPVQHREAFVASCKRGDIKIMRESYNCNNTIVSVYVKCPQYRNDYIRGFLNGLMYCEKTKGGSDDSSRSISPSAK